MELALAVAGEREANLSDDDRCTSCGDVDTAGHAIFACSRWDNMRSRVERSLGMTLEVENVIGLMLNSRND